MKTNFARSSMILDSSSPERWYHKVLFGDWGLRAGWGLLLYFALIFLSQAIVDGIPHWYGEHHPAFGVALQQAESASRDLHDRKPGGVLISHGKPIAVVLLLLWIMAKTERRPFAAYGWSTRHRARDFAVGFLCGFVLLSSLVGVLWLAHLLVFDGILLSGPQALLYGIKWLLAFCLVGLSEEFLLRGYFQYTLARGFAGLIPKRISHRYVLGFSVAAILLAIDFGAGHSSHSTESMIGLVQAGSVGLLFSYSLWRSGSLWWAIGAHASWDWTQSYLFGVGDSGVLCHGRLLASHPVGQRFLSGGATGPEGSILAFGFVLLGTLLVRFTLPKRPYPMGLIPASMPSASQTATFQIIETQGVNPS
jgi:membrane protease YdiL (CAAX protease family)